MTLAEEVTFINKGAILKELESIPRDTILELDVRNTRFLDYDIVEILEDFSEKARQRNINIKVTSEKDVVDNPTSFIEIFKKYTKSA
jgi:MFS superfamily sulfate permease-like transporter